MRPRRLVVVALIGIFCVAASRVPAQQQDGQPASAIVRVLTLNIAYGRHAPLSRVAAAIRASGADVVALQEVDRHTRRAPEDQAGVLAAALGMHHAYAPAIAWQGGTFGVAILARWPLHRVQIVPLPLLAVDQVPPARRRAYGCRPADIEQRVLLLAELELPAPAAPVVVGSTHLGLCGMLERQPQLDAIDSALAALAGAPAAAGAVIVGGDFNQRWGDGRSGWRLLAGNDVDWVLGAGDCLRGLGASILVDRVSDHAGVLAQVEVVPPEECSASRRH